MGLESPRWDEAKVVVLRFVSDTMICYPRLLECQPPDFGRPNFIYALDLGQFRISYQSSPFHE